MPKRSVRVAVVTNVIPSYRRAYYRALIAALGSDFAIFCQTHIEGMNLVTVHCELGDCVTTVRHFGAKRERIGWQFLPFFRLVRDFDVVFVHGNPRTLSNVVLVSLLQLFRRGVVIAGQAHTAGASYLSESIRLAWWRTVKHLFVYTELCRTRLKARNFQNHVIVSMNNGLDQAPIRAATEQWSSELAAWQEERGLRGKIVLLSCARLESKNRFELMIDALSELKHRFSNLEWCVIGDGRCAGSLREYAAARGCGSSIRWLGPMYSEMELAPWFLSSYALVHPGAIGLSLLHAYGYGLPVLTHDNDENHMPEISAFAPTSVVWRFREGSSQDLAGKILMCLKDPQRRGEVSAEAREIVSRGYNTAVMAERFLEMVRLVADCRDT